MIVLVAISEKQVPITDSFNPEPLTHSGPAGIFARATRPSETVAQAEIVGIFTTAERADQAQAGHSNAHPGRTYTRATCEPDSYGGGTPVEARCIDCHVPTGGPTRCQPCQKAFWDACRAADPELV